MAIVQDLLDRFRQLQADRSPWEASWRQTCVYALPDADRFDRMFASSGIGSVMNAVVGEPVAANRSREIYDMTSLWAIDRGASGTVSLVMPQSSTWHDLSSADPYGGEPTDEEERWYETLRNYLFAARANPKSGFSVANKASIRCMWAFGTGVMFIEESSRGIASPISYRYIPLSENHLGVNHEGNVDTNFRLFSLSARQAVQKYGNGVSSKTRKMAEDVKDKDKPVSILHAVYPRDESGSYGNTNRDSAFASCTVEIEEKHLIGESGFYGFPYRVDHWQRNNAGPYAEGPMAMALAEVKSLNMLSKQELRAVQQWVDPPYATMSGTERVNLNPRAPNPGFLDEQGNLKIKPIITQQRPDFAQTILAARREAVGKTLYVQFWTAIMDSTREKTAFEQMKVDAERGDLLGPMGTSVQTGLAFQIEREIDILSRKDAFAPSSPLAAPRSLQGKDFPKPRWTSPLDRLRRMGELQGMNQLASSVAQVAQFNPAAIDKINWDAFIDEEQFILGAPKKIMASDEDVARTRQQRAAAQNAQTAIAATHGAGEAATAAGEGVEAIASSPAASEVLKRLAGVAGVPA